MLISREKSRDLGDCETSDEGSHGKSVCCGVNFILERVQIACQPTNYVEPFPLVYESGLSCCK